MFRPLPSLLLATLLVTAAGACSGDESSDAAPSTTVAPTTTSTAPPAPTTTIADPSPDRDGEQPAGQPTTPSRPTSSPRPPTTVARPPAEAAPDGSGCTVDGATVPDGRWFGMVSSASAGELGFDLACWFSGEAAVTAAAQDGEESPPPNDYHIRNENPRVRSLRVHPDATARWVRETGDPTTEVETAYDQWLTARADGMVFGIWVEVRDGVVRQVEEQWVP